MKALKSYQLLVPLILLLAACKSNYIIESPREGEVHTQQPEFRIVYEQPPASSPLISLNGFDVRAHFQFGDTEATALGADLTPYLEQGINSFQVSPPAGPVVKFIYDTEGPDIVVLNSAVDAMASIAGVAVDKGGLASLTVNGNPATLGAQNTFNVELPANNVYVYQAVDSLGHAKTTHYSALGTTYSPAMTLGVSQSVLDVATTQMVNAFNVLPLNALLAGTVLFNGTWQGPWGETYGPEVVIETIGLNADNAGMDLHNGSGGVLYSNSTINAVLLLRLHNGLSPAWEVSAPTQIGPVSLKANLALGVQNNALDVSITNFSASMGQINAGSLGEPFDTILVSIYTILNAVFDAAIAPQLELVFQNVVPVLLESAIRNSYTINIPDFFAGHSLALALSLDNVYTTEQGLFANLRGGGIPIDINEYVPQPLAGVIYKPDPLPGAVLDGGQFAFSLNTNTINQVYASSFAAGLNHINLAGGEVQYGLPRNDNLGGQSVANRLLVDSVAPPSRSSFTVWKSLASLVRLMEAIKMI